MLSRCKCFLDAEKSLELVPDSSSDSHRRLCLVFNILVRRVLLCLFILITSLKPLLAISILLFLHVRTVRVGKLDTTFHLLEQHIRICLAMEVI